ncbi:FAD-dependent oxidoreductase [Formosa agariphila KMM 3901]|uniref:FAD-dependent oxidoreductase n=1 Tax=Formosa agariphila (strain DSM 15362 / KCTC 12365 / LMG 23005 / KMM 3901 / M-2Alg 35-1) TaxID=1347342 RepID=T2KLD3_FORAG|nr:FAD-dependent oxidoreductase [Formosa agariphila]CDF79555.1 FAD-dependent oxidoreductase [Formosa agariphila KMM 3901]
MNLTSNEPFWLIKNGLLESYPSIKTDMDTDILVVSAGITGSLMAHKCMSNNYRTMVIDRRDVANGSTSATTSMLQYEIDVPLFKLTQRIGKSAAEANYWACYNAIDTLHDIVKSIGSDCGFKKKESLYFAASEADVADLKTEFSARQACGLPVTWLSAEDIQKKYKLKQTFGGILSKQGGSLDAFKLTHDLLKYNAARGLDIFDKTEIVSVEQSANGVTINTNYGCSISAKKIIYCNGYESTELIADNFVKLLSTYAIIGEQQDDDQPYLNDTLFWNTAEPYLYMRTTDDNRVLIGGEDEDFVNPDKRDALLHEKSIMLKTKLNTLLPHYKFRTDFAWAGTFGETKDGLPYIGEHPDFKHSYFVLGFGGNGITFSVIGAAVISDMLAGKTHPLQSYFKFRR